MMQNMERLKIKII